MNNKNRIYFFADFGNFKVRPRGGGEAGNRKTLQLLRTLGFDVIIIPKYLHSSSQSILGRILLFLKMSGCIVKYAYILLFGRRERSIVHISGFYGNIIYFEAVLVGIAKIFGYKVVYEMRGGGAGLYYEQYGHLYKSFFRWTLIHSNKIFTQGQENIPLITECSPKADIYYYPNYVMTGFYPQEYPRKNFTTINIIYFGRVSKSKNVDLIVDAFAELVKTIDNIKLYIVGDSEEPEYYSIIKEKISHNCRDKAELKPACDHTELMVYLRRMHFFIFPSTLGREGHSNALTEAMSWGIIPIVSSQGFNRSVVGDDALVLKTLSSAEIEEKIKRIILGGQIERYSRLMYNRVLTHYTEEIAASRLNEVYNSMFTKWF